MSNLIIVDRKHKRANSDNNWDDPLSVEHAKREKARTIEIPKDSKLPIHEALRSIGVKGLLGRKVFCITEKMDVLSGNIQDIMPPDFIMIRNKGVARFKDCIAIESNDK